MHANRLKIQENSKYANSMHNNHEKIKFKKTNILFLHKKRAQMKL